MLLLQPLRPYHITREAEQAGEQVRLVDGLELLARSGYEVIIPEMVAYECAHVLADGTWLKKYAHIDKSYANSWEKECLDFLETLSEAKGSIYIAPPPPNDQSDPAIFMNRLWEIHTSNATDKEKWLDIQEATVELYKTKKHYGDVAAAELVKDMNPKHVPVFYLADDGDAITNVVTEGRRKGLNISGLHTAHFCEALGKGGFFPFLEISDRVVQKGHYHKVIYDIKKDIAAQDPKKASNTPHKQKSHKKAPPPPETQLEEALRKAGISVKNWPVEAPSVETHDTKTDNTIQAHATEHNTVAAKPVPVRADPHPFEESLAGLANRIVEQQVWEEKAKTAEGLSQTDKFNIRKEKARAMRVRGGLEPLH